MPTPPPPSQRPPRQGAVQSSSQQPSATVLRTGRRIVAGAMDSRFLARYNDWQDWARRYTRTLGIARFANSITADTCARCIIRPEQRDENGDWAEVEDDAELTDALEEYRNEQLGQGSSELVRAHAWHYQVAGEGAIVWTDGSDGLDWFVFSLRAIEWDWPLLGQAMIRLIPGGKVTDRTAFVVPRKQVVRFWNPDEEWPGYATSPMASSIDDLHRIAALARFVRRTASSRLAMSGMVWTPGEAHEDTDSETGEQVTASKIERDYWDIAQGAIEDDDNPASIIPPMFHWQHDWGKPEWTEVGRGLDPHLLEHMEAAQKDYARGINLPTSLVIGGGPGEGNHWSDWLVDEKFFEAGVAPTMDRITHGDMTRTFLRPWLRLRGRAPDGLRVGYDPGPVIVRPDQSELALRLHLAGLLEGKAVLEAGNFDPDRIMKPAELARLLEILSKGAVEDGSDAVEVLSGRGRTRVTPANVRRTPPELPTGRGAAAGNGQGAGERLAALLHRVSEIRQAAGRDLIRDAQVTLRLALHRAGVKILNTARRRRVTLPEGVVTAAAAGEPMAPHLSAVGVSEADALRDAFAAYRPEALARLRRMDGDLRAEILAAGLNPTTVLGPDRSEDAVDTLIAGLEHTAAGRLRDGRERDSELPRVPATVVLGALAIASGRSIATLGGPLEEPEITGTGQPTLEERIAGDRPVRWQFVHGFYGEPDHPFEPHVMLDGEETATPDDFYFQPADHRGCTCAWVAVGLDAEGEPIVRGGPEGSHGGLGPAEQWPEDPRVPEGAGS